MSFWDRFIINYCNDRLTQIQRRRLSLELDLRLIISRKVIMAQSQNKKVLLQTTGVSYLSMGGNVGKFLVGDVAFEFYNDRNVEDYIQIPWTSIDKIGANVSGKKVSRHFEIFTDSGKFLFASKDSGKILKIAREKVGNDKVVKLPTLWQTLIHKLRKR